MKNRGFYIIGIFFFLCSYCYTTEFLKINPDVRSMGMGCINNGISEYSSALYLNPAGLALMRNHEISFSHLFWPLSNMEYIDDFNIQYEYLGYAQSFGKSGVGINLSHYHQPLYEYGSQSYSIYSGFSSLTYAYNFYYFTLGARIKAVWDVLGDYNGKTFAGDIGLLYYCNFLKLYKGNEKNVALGCSLFNVGPGLVMYKEIEALPFSFQVGYSYIVFHSKKGKLLLGNDIRYYISDNNLYRQIEINSGIEYTFFDILNLRVGSILSSPLKEYTEYNNNRYTCGVGINHRIFSYKLMMNYSFINSFNNQENSIHAISLTIRKINFFEHMIK